MEQILNEDRNGDEKEEMERGEKSGSDHVMRLSWDDGPGGKLTLPSIFAEPFFCNRKIDLDIILNESR
jgi:hypothetical protein